MYISAEFIEDDNLYYGLANAIVKTAYEDAMKEIEKIKKNNKCNLTELEQILRFFVSDWYTVLTKLDRKVILEDLRNKINEVLEIHEIKELRDLLDYTR